MARRALRSLSEGGLKAAESSAIRIRKPRVGARGALLHRGEKWKLSPLVGHGDSNPVVDITCVLPLNLPQDFYRKPRPTDIRPRGFAAYPRPPAEARAGTCGMFCGTG
ncbi:MAG: hypothetical protein O6918_08485 [Deltaproteobacteria bacterium]|nr:hypothetical protein [Deltaproteobacteria bacterium]